MSQTAENLSQVVGTATAIGLSKAAVDHREEFRRYVLQEAEAWHRQHLGRLYDLWEAWNGAYFAARMVPPYILLNEPVVPRAYGDCGRVSGFGGWSQIRLRPSLLWGSHPHLQSGDEYGEGRFLFVADVLLHEMGHQWQQEVTGELEESYHGHGPEFRDLCNQIGAELGLRPVRTCKARGKEKELPSCSQWPHNVRPPDYYQGAYQQATGDISSTRRQVLEWAREYGQAVTAGDRHFIDGQIVSSPRKILERLGQAAVRLYEAEQLSVPATGDTDTKT